MRRVFMRRLHALTHHMLSLYFSSSFLCSPPHRRRLVLCMPTSSTHAIRAAKSIYKQKSATVQLQLQYQSYNITQ